MSQTMDLGLACLAGADPPGAATIVAAGAALLAIGAARKTRTLPFAGLPRYVAYESDIAYESEDRVIRRGWTQRARRVVRDFAAGRDGCLALFRNVPLSEEMLDPSHGWRGPDMFPGVTAECAHVVADQLQERGDPYGDILALELAGRPWLLASPSPQVAPGLWRFTCCNPPYPTPRYWERKTPKQISSALHAAFGVVEVERGLFESATAEYFFSYPGFSILAVSEVDGPVDAIQLPRIDARPGSVALFQPRRL